MLEAGAEDEHQLDVGADVALEGEGVGGGAAHPVFHVRRESVRAQGRAAPRKAGARVGDQHVAQLGEPALAEGRLLSRADDEHGSAPSYLARAERGSGLCDNLHAQGWRSCYPDEREWHPRPRSMKS